jgi:prepilin-type N-terminal cleavage/methylation domain-containing protein
MNSINKWNKGFTLVETLTVILIVGLIAGMITAGVAYSRIKGRDARRIADASQIRLALEQYFTAFKRYPNSTPDGYCGLQGYLASYLSAFPKDPNSTNAVCDSTYKYEYYTNANLAPSQYILRIPSLELPSTQRDALSSDTDGNVAPSGGGNWRGGVAPVIVCTAGAPCATVDCGAAANDTIYCLGS